MDLRKLDRLELPPTADMHVHLRQGAMMELVVPQIRKGGVDTVFVMPNLQPPITTVPQALEYHAALQRLDPSVRYLMSLYLHASTTPATIAEAAAAVALTSSSSSANRSPIAGVKVYPAGVTTNSEHGVTTLEPFYPVLAAMEQADLVLNLHGEVAVRPATASPAATDEELFLPTLHALHARFPRLRIVLEHCTTAAAVAAVRRCKKGVVGATITAHHLYLTSDDAAVDPHAWCKPVPKTPADRDALLRAVVDGDGCFFFGTDSAPHPLVAKQRDAGADGEGRGGQAKKTPPAGVFTQPYATQHVLAALEEAMERGVLAPEEVTRERLEGFLCHYGRAFYKLPPVDGGMGRIVLERKGERVPESVRSDDGNVEVGVSRAGRETWSLRWE